MNEEYKKKLEEEKVLLENELSSLGTKVGEGDFEVTLDETNESDDNDRADRMEEYTEKSSTLNTLEARLDEVTSALSKMELGTYGVCEVCGEIIEADRLDANPSAKTCKAHM